MPARPKLGRLASKALWRLWSRMMADHRRDLLARNLELQGHRCCWCEEPCPDEARGGQASLEHIRPKSFRGEDTYENTAAAHHRCNCARGNRPWEEWWLAIQIAKEFA